MGLATYRRKRDFRRTTEPTGRKGASRRKGLIYAIQKHAARRLHYDLRLEWGGTLLSWAVPKGPSPDPREKRLAVAVEDHPLEYAGFEGVVPKGEYGAGTVELWDRGTWTPEGDPAEALRKGKLKFRIDGEKLRGRWVLVRMGGQADGKNWLLMKSPESTVQSLQSVQSAKPGQSLPDWLEPQLATLVESPPADEGWLHEIKFDGYRLQCRIDGKDVRLFTRHESDWTDRFPAIAKAARELPVKQAVLDGEVVILDEKGVSSFQSLQNALRRGTQERLIYYVFDLLYLDGTDLREAPLARRKKLLGEVVKGSAKIRFTEHLEGHGPEFYRQACGHGLEGIVSKKKEGRYRPGRGRDWLKVKCLDRQEFVIGGFADPEGSRAGFGALLLGTYGAKGELAYRGRVGTGFTEKSLAELHRRLKKLERTSPAFANPPTGAMARGVRWTEPQLVAQVEFHGWTEDDLIRQGAFQGLREDKPARRVVRETPDRRSAAAGVRLTHPDRILYPAQGITKSDLAAYYEEIADRILPHIAGRPLSLLRCPDGFDKECFFQKHAFKATPRQIRRVVIREEGKEQTHLHVADAAGLIALVQMGVLEIHPWGSRVDRLEYPDRMIFDLDPGPEAAWELVAAGARHLRDRLSQLDLRSFVKTTGGNGLHVVVPLDPVSGWDEVRAFARRLAEEMARAAPQYYTATVSKARRTGKVYVDYVRNRQGATAVAPFSTRARDGAPVSVPLSWDEVNKDLRSDRYTIANVRERLERLRRDPWEGFFEVRQKLPSPHQFRTPA